MPTSSKQTLGDTMSLSESLRRAPDASWGKGALWPYRNMPIQFIVKRM